MKRSFAKARPLATLGLFALAAQCGNPQSPRVTPQVQNNPDQGTARGVVRPTQLPTPQTPADLLVLARISSPGALAERLGRMVGSGAVVTAAVDDLLREATHGRELAGLVDRTQSLDMALLHNERGREIFAYSMAMPSMESVQSAVGQQFRFVEAPGSVLRLEPIATQTDQARPGRSREQHSHCLLVPVNRADRSRLVCFDHSPNAEVASWLARGVAAQPAVPDSVHVELAADTVRARYGPQALRAIDEVLGAMPAALTELAGRSAGSPLGNAQVRELLLGLGRDFLENARSLVNESAGLSFTLTLREDRIVMRGEFDVRNPTGTLVRAWADALGQTRPVPPSLFTHLLPNGEAYFAGSVRNAPLVPWLDRLVELGTQLLHAENALPAADLAAVHQALEHGLHGPDALGVGVTGRDDAGHFWSASSSHFASEAEVQQAMTELRELLATVRRPGVARALDHALDRLAQHGTVRTPSTVHVRDLRDMPARGLPAGALGLRLPASETLTALLSSMGSGFGALRNAALHTDAVPTPPRRPGQPASPGMEVLWVPEGTDLHMVVGVGAAALYTRFHANTQPGLDPALLDTTENAVVEAFVPRGIVEAIQRETAARPGAATRTPDPALARFLASQDGGRTPVFVRIPAVRATDGVTRMAMELEISAATLGAIGTAATGGASTPPPPPPVSGQQPAPPAAGH